MIEDELKELLNQPPRPSADDPIYAPFARECEELFKIAQKYNGRADELLAAAEHEVVRWGYAHGGQTMHRGYYCPSLIHDIVIGNNDRGKLYQRMTAKCKPSFQYGFNERGELILVYDFNEHGAPYEAEVIFYSGDETLGIAFAFQKFTSSWSSLPVAISRCVYKSGKLLSYCYVLIGDPPVRRHLVYSKEEYSYLQQEALTVTWSEYSELVWKGDAPEKRCLLRQARYHFEVKDGHLSDYTVDMTYDGIAPKNPGQREYKTYIRRKV